MAEDDKKEPAADYKVGYGKPPKHTQFKAGSAGQERRGRAAKSGRGRPNTPRGTIDVSAVLSERVTVTKDGAASKMPPFEVALRAQVKKALTEQNLAAIRNIVALCVEHGLIAPPPQPPATGGVLEIPKTFSEAAQRAIFDAFEPPMELIEKAVRMSHAKRR